MKEIVVLDGYTLNPGDLSWEGFERLGKLTVYEHTPEAEIVGRIGKASIVMTNKTPISQEVLSQCPEIEYVGVLATGYNVVDIEAARQKGVVVTNVPTYGTSAVAQYAIALLLELCHNIGCHSQAVQQGRWTSGRDFCFWDYPLIELCGKTMGIIGYGRIGKATGQIAKALGMNVIAYNRSPSPGEEGVEQTGDLDELLRKSDVISLHCPLTSSTQGMINRESIAKMKDGVMIINTSRGSIINEGDLAQALESGKVYAAALDVVSKEPIAADNPLLKAKNCMITPHIAWAAKDSRQRLMDIAVDNLKSYLSDRPINVVNT